MSEENKPELHEFKDGEWAWSPHDGWSICLECHGKSLYYIKHGRFTYTERGLFLLSIDKYPSLLTEDQANKLGYFRPKPKVKKKVSAWANVYPDGARLYVKKDDANISADHLRRIACVELVGEYEVEE